MLALLWALLPIVALPLWEQAGRAWDERAAVAACRTYAAASSQELYRAQCEARMAAWPWRWLGEDADVAAWRRCCWQTAVLLALWLAQQTWRWWARRDREAAVRRCIEEARAAKHQFYSQAR
jgi:hypothetical protein